MIEVPEEAASPSAETRRRGVHVALRLGVIMLTTGAQAQEAEASLCDVMHAFGLRHGDAIVTASSVTVSCIAPGDAEATTAIQAVRELRYDFGRLAAATALANAIQKHRTGVGAAEAELDQIVAMVPPYPRWLGFIAPALLSAAVTILFDGSPLDSLATLFIGLAIQPAMERIEASALPVFFQTVFGVFATAILIVVLEWLRLPLDGKVVMTGGLLRFLPGAQLVAGMRDLIGRAIVPGVANLADVFLLGVAIAFAASLVLAIGKSLLGVDLRVSAEGHQVWVPLVIVAAGAMAVSAYCIRLGVPPRLLPSVALLGALVVLISQDMFSVTAEIGENYRIIMAALIVGVIGRLLAKRLEQPPAIWLVPAILPLLPAPATLVPLLAATENTRASLQAQALTTAFLIGVGVASGDILISIYQRHRMRNNS